MSAGTVRATSRWEDMIFTADRCRCCGVALSVSRIGKDSLELIEAEHMAEESA